MTTGSFQAGRTTACAVSAAHRLKLGQHHRQFVRRVLGVDENPVEPGIGEDLDHEMARETVPQAELQPAGLERLLEGVAEGVHWEASGFALL